ncbi:hypothetical protein G647_05879 [Cladophialophora carrionii CBS 160.54]|uniref:Uncharacterized protein n=1 Tax=Cladophialophora carrionii CBS 160.54 TaxID=1279043 RepID=V9D4L4_9EURO|nr:uncharacterized protein G647_05879 [Cladophialophora carrionii CBS 160.54]ETI21810.1 hypothetical protein G647_05879 [Cladophialophora carrionii CBS 160.54]
MTAPAVRQHIRQAYRDLYRTGLEAVQFSTPARYELRDILRQTFRTSPPSNFNPRRIQNTIKFLENARKYDGFEHKIVKNLLHLQYWKGRPLDRRLKHSIRDLNTTAAIESRKQIWHQYRATLIMLNESLDICLTI